MHQFGLSRIVALVVTLLVSGVGHAIVATWAFSAFPGLSRHRHVVLRVVVVLTLLAPIARLVGVLAPTDRLSWIMALAVTEAMLVVIAAIPLALVRVGIRLRMPRVDPVALPGSSHDGWAGGRRQALERVAGLVTLGSAGAAFGWGMVRGRHAFETEEVVVRIPGLPSVLDGYTLMQISDVHAGIFVGDRELNEGLSRVREGRPDLLVVTGDLVDFDPRHAPRLARALIDVGARDGVVAIVGNHDYYAGVGTVTDAMRAAGVDILLNAGRTMRAQDGGGFALLGVDDLWARRAGGQGPNLERALAMVRPDAPRILLAHQPSYLDIAAGTVALQLSGHTHGGQINPGFRPIDFVAHYVAGRYERKGTTLWVNRGFGVAGPPVRLGAPPEVTKIVLVTA